MRLVGLSARGAGRSETGRVREVNEDRILLVDDLGRGASLFAVADGLGGHARGDLASTMVVETLRNELPALLAGGSPARDALVEALRRANAAIHAHAQAEGLTGMATTCTAFLAGGRAGIVAHVGDSRAYLLRAQEVRQLTADHSLVSELARRGSLTPAEVETHAQRHILTRALGAAPDVDIDVIDEPLRPGDVVVLATDGLHTAVPSPEIHSVIRSSPDAEEACSVLLGLANARGGFDNASVVIIRLAPWWMGRAAARLLAPVGLAALLAAGVAAYRLDHAYFLGVRGDMVAVMWGTPARVLGLPLSGVIKVTEVPVARIAPADRPRLIHGIPAGSAKEAESVLRDLLSHQP